jgi:nucleoside-diphosphate-sugar epimerase
MRLLILGGTVFLGRHVATEAYARGHDVTLFTRGLHGADLFPDADHLRGDRASDLSALRGRTWDAAVDTSGYEPAHVRASSRLLAHAVEHLAFVSTLNVYPDWPDRPVDEDSRVHQGDEEEYGPLKAACERVVGEVFGDRAALLRVGLLAGPYDNIFRLPWWVARIARGGRVLAPGRPDRELQLVDARDLAAWILDLAEARRGGVWNATAPVGQTTMSEVLDAASAATGSDAELQWVPDEALASTDVQPWTELPLWIPEHDAPGAFRVSAERARRDGLRCRPIADTVADVWAWLRDGGAERLSDWQADARAPGLGPEQERELLAKLA